MLEGPGNQTWRIIHSLWSEQDDVIARDKIIRVKSKDFLSFLSQTQQCQYPVLSGRRGHRTQVSAQVTEDTSHCNAMTSSQTRPVCTIYNAIRECFVCVMRKSEHRAMLDFNEVIPLSLPPKRWEACPGLSSRTPTTAWTKIFQSGISYLQRFCFRNVGNDLWDVLCLTLMWPSFVYTEMAC